MYIDNDDFSIWMQKLYAKLEELCKDVRVLRNADRVLPEDDNLLDNQDLCLLFKVSIKTLQRYRAIGALPYFTISGTARRKRSEFESRGGSAPALLWLMAYPTCRLSPLAARLARSAALPALTFPPASCYGIQTLSPNRSGFGRKRYPVPGRTSFPVNQGCCRLLFLSSGYSGILYHYPVTAAFFVQNVHSTQATQDK